MRAKYVNEDYRGTELDKAMAWGIDMFAFDHAGYSEAYIIGERVVLAITPQEVDEYSSDIYDFDASELIGKWREYQHTPESEEIHDAARDWLYDHDSQGAFSGLPTKALENA